MQVGVLLVGWGWTYEQLKRGWTEIEELGFDLLYIGDDLFPHPDVDDAVYEPWTVLPAIAATTERIKLGSLVSPAGRRHPGLFAKMTTEVDHIAGPGRLVVGMGLGNSPEQQHTLNQPFPGPAERAAMLREELRILKSLWTAPRTSVEGEYWQVRDAINEPKPASAPHPDILLAFRSRKYVPLLAAEFADRVNMLQADDELVLKAIDELGRHCQAAGRDVSDIVFGRPASLMFTDHEVETDQLAGVIEARAREIEIDPDYLKREHQQGLLSYVGPPERCAEALKRRTADIGVTELVVCVDTIGRNSYDRTMEGLRAFASAALPEMRGWHPPTQERT